MAAKGLPQFLQNLEKLNHRKRIKLRARKIQKGGYSLYIDLWHNNNREYEFLKLYIIGKKNTINQDKETLRLAVAIRDKKELELIQKTTGFELQPWKDKINFIEYFENYISSSLRQGNNGKSALKHFKSYIKNNPRIRDINEKLCKSFKEYLLEHVSTNSANVYFGIFKACLKEAVIENIIPKNPAQSITVRRDDTEREFLTSEEIKVLVNTPCKDNNLKNAFIFSCFTGLRLSDIQKLHFSNLREGYAYLKQKKTRDILRLKLQCDALKMVDLQRNMTQDENELIFRLKSNSQIHRDFKDWIKNSGIKKHITFHSGRHTFATLCLTYDVDLYTVSKLLGHRDIKTTQIYAKLIDKKKDEAIDKLPALF